MWREGMWYDDERTTALGHLRNGGIVIAAFLLTGTIFIGLQRGFDSVNKRISGAYLRPGEEPGATPAFSNAPAPLAPMSTPLNTYTPASLQSLTPTGSTPVNPTLYRIPEQFTAFATDAERQQARAALSDLSVALKDFRDYDSKGLPQTIALGDSGNKLVTVATGSEPGANGTDAMESQAIANARMQLAIDRVSQETEALGSLVSLTGHPDRFPEAFREGAGQLARELHTYLQDVRYAVALPDDRSRLLAVAGQHLAQAEALMQDMQQRVGGRSGTASLP